MAFMFMMSVCILLTLTWSSPYLCISCVFCSCWINNKTVSYITVNGYLGLVLLFNIVIMGVIVVKVWQLKLRGVQTGNRLRRLWKDCAIILGLGVVLGLSWGLAFFTYGPLSLSGIYTFTILNSFQGKCTKVIIFSDFFFYFCYLLLRDVFPSSRCFCVLLVLITHLQVNSRGRVCNKEFILE